MLHAQINQVLERTEIRLRVARNYHLGYPYNLVPTSGIPSAFGDYLINNLGDPYTGSHYGSEVCDLEREAVAWLMALWQCNDLTAYWGFVGASGTEGNFWALYLAREALPEGVLVHSSQAHCSILNAARILRIKALSVDCEPGGAVDVNALARALTTINGRSVILALTCGTSMTGAHDDIQLALQSLEAAGYGPARRFVHVDGALNAMVLPFASEAPIGIRPSFQHGIDSLSTSGHKMIGTPMPCGMLIASRRYVDQVASAISYLRSNDTTLMGSRNGHAVLAIWARLVGHGIAGFTADVRRCLKRTDCLVERLSSANVPTLRNPYSLTVVFPEPPAPILGKYQLVSDEGRARAIVMPSVSDKLIDQFLDDYLGWWKSGCAVSSQSRLADTVILQSVEGQTLSGRS